MTADDSTPRPDAELNFIDCPNCGKRVQQQAPACPGCGRKMYVEHPGDMQRVRNAALDLPPAKPAAYRPRPDSG